MKNFFTNDIVQKKIIIKSRKCSIQQSLKKFTQGLKNCVHARVRVVTCKQKLLNVDKKTFMHILRFF